ncbi:hypothetical protein SpCBS45565_g05326 [Spizellomyces sp. 'palustris']|nr:hypothetical protein SpCBS45565_g05326 [Spizellomyces sp. 'palustris']
MAGAVMLLMTGASYTDGWEGRPFGAKGTQNVNTCTSPSGCGSEGDDEGTRRDAIFTSVDALRLAQSYASRLFRVNGFEFCDILNGATFDGLVEIAPLGGSVAQVNPTEQEFAQLLDGVAREAQERLSTKYPVLMERDVHRYICYSVAEGANSFVNITSSPLIHRIDPISYYSSLIPAITPSLPSRIPGPRRKYPLAYLLMLHDIATLQQAQLLIDRLDDGSAVFLIHVDARSNKLRTALKDWIDQRQAERYKKKLQPDPVGNLFIAKTSYEGMWGHASLVWMQLSGYWELLDLADWDFVINLSGHDWPLRTSAEMYRTLNSSDHQGKEHIEFWTEPSDSAGRLVRPHMGRSDRPTVEWSLYHPPDVGLSFYPFPAWRACKQHQWMILTSNFLRDLRTNVDAMHLLAFMEHTWIPDESYFCMVIANHPHFSQNVVYDKKRYLRFATQHPVSLTLEDKDHFPPEDPPGTEAKYFFVRKVNAVGNNTLVDWIRVNHIDKHDLRARPESKAVVGEMKAIG